MIEPVIETTTGRVRGAVEHGVARFLDVPYAAPPVGADRFRAPRAHERWDGERDASRAGPCAPQIIRKFPGLDVVPLVGTGGADGTDYLTANVWTPAAGGGGLPVMVFIHGGAFLVGSNAASVHDGSAFARSGIVCIAINYRLGVDGFLVLPGAPTNLGLRDQLFALAWVRENARAFGGDPDNVTVFGESAGAMSIADLVTSPLARGLFRRAIVQSGHGSMVRPIDVAERLTRKLAALLGLQASAESFRTRSAAECLAAVEKVQQPTTRIDLRGPDRREPAYGLSRFLPVYGDDVLPQPPLHALATGAGKDVDLLIGTNAEEMNLYFVPLGVKAKLNRVVAWLALRRVEPHAWAMLRAYGLGRPGRRPGEAFTDALTDLVFRGPARRYAAAHRGRTHCYEFDWRSPAFDGALGACHGVELPFVFRTLATCTGPQGLVGQSPPEELAERVHRTWVSYATDGTLPWSEYTADSRAVYSLANAAVNLETPFPMDAEIR